MTERPPSDDTSRGGGLLDLPLGPDRPAAEPAAPAARRSPKATPVTPEGPPPAAHRRRWLLPLAAVLLAAAGVAVGHFWPRSTPPVARLSEALLDFGEQRSGGTSNAREVVLTNGGRRLLEVTAVALAGEAPQDFTLVADGCSGRRLGREEPCTLMVGFAPAPGGAGRRAVLEVAGTFANSPLRLPLLGTAVAPLPSLDRRRVDFGEQPVGSSGPVETLVLRNRGTGPLALGAVVLEGEGFVQRSDFCTGTTLEPGGRCSLGVAFQPAAVGEARGAVVFPSDLPARVELIGIGVPALARLEARPAEVAYGDRPVGAAASTALEVANPGSDPLAVRRVAVEETGGGAGTGFTIGAESCTGAPVAAGGGCAVTVVFTPRREGAATAELVLLWGEEGEIRVPLSGAGVLGRLAFGVQALDLGAAALGGRAGPRPVTLTSVGSSTAQVRGLTLAGPDAAAFSLAADGCSGRDLPPGGGCSAEVLFRPRRDGRHQARLGVRAGAGAEEVDEVVLTGTGLAPRLAVTPESLLWGEVEVGAGEEQRLTLENPGGATLTVRSLTLGGADSTAFRLREGSCGEPPVVLAPRGSCRLAVRFEPPRAGRWGAVLSLDHDGVSGPRRVVVSGAAAPPPAPEVTLDPSRVGFGELAVGQRSGIETVRLSNTGAGRLTLGGIRLQGPEAGDFQIVPGTCDGLAFLAPGGDCTVGLRFLPTSAGERRGRLVVESDAPGGRKAVELSGRGVGAGGE